MTIPSVRILDIEDLPAAIREDELAQAMVDGANAKASRVAPCLVATDPAATTQQVSEARLVLIGAVKRWADASSGALSSQTAGPFGQVIDTRQRTGFTLWPSEIKVLQEICATDATSGAFSLDVGPPLTGLHLPWCALNFGATYCSCGVDIAGYPIFEL